MELEPISEKTLLRLPVFPLPETVLFPGTVLPLHVFEPRYRAMIEEALAGDKAVAIVMLKSEAGQEEARADIYDVACAGRIIHAEKLEGGRYNILVHGLHRVRLIEELPLEGTGYRRFRTEVIPTPEGPSLDRASRELARLQSCVLSLQQSVEESDAQLVEVLSATSDPVQLADILSAAVISDTALRQRLLASGDLVERLRTLIDALAEVMVKTGAPPKELRMN